MSGWEHLPPTPIDDYHMDEGGPDWPWAIALAGMVIGILALVLT